MAIVSERALGRWENEGGGLVRELREQFPGVRDWHYLDTAATAQKPQAVIDAVSRAIGEDYATVHRGVYARSANMTLAYEAARRRVAEFIGGKEDEIVFVRGATEAINLVAHSYPKKGRVLLSQLEHHSNIVPWQLAGYGVDVCPLTPDGCIDLDAAEAMLTEEHVMAAFAHVSNVLGSVLDAKRAAALAHRSGQSCCSTAARRFRACPSTSPIWTAISMSSAGTNCTAQPVSARYGGARNCSTLCPPTKAAGR